jgi:hypothetical protein
VGENGRGAREAPAVLFLGSEEEHARNACARKKYFDVARLFIAPRVGERKTEARAGVSLERRPRRASVAAAKLAWPLIQKTTRRKTMRRLIIGLVSAAAIVVSAQAVHAQDLFVPAGTLLQCTMDEPNFSSKTAAVGDPVLCHLRSFQEFGRQIFPRGSMLGGHLDAEKEPGHFFGKGYLRITFDRVILPAGDVPVPAKLVGAKGYKVDKEGDIDGKGHAKRDLVEWMIPPLWPWKFITLPARGPRPTLKGEEPLQLRLMDDIVVPRALAYGSNRPPYASSSAGRPSVDVLRPASATAPAVLAPAAVPATTTPAATVPAIPQATEIVVTNPVVTDSSAATTAPAGRFTTLVLKSNEVYEVNKYQINGTSLKFRRLDGQEGSVEVNQIDWVKTTEMSTGVRSVDLPTTSGTIN